MEDLALEPNIGPFETLEQNQKGQNRSQKIILGGPQDALLQQKAHIGNMAGKASPHPTLPTLGRRAAAASITVAVMGC